jgi:uncharacterized low-complexity protein
MNNKTKTPLALAIGTAFAASLATTNIANAAPSNSNPFAMSDMSSGYMHVADTTEGKCGGAKPAQEGKCGAAKTKNEGKCGEGKCGAAKTKNEGKCGGAKEMEKSMEGKCGGAKPVQEGKCGGQK